MILVLLSMVQILEGFSEKPRSSLYYLIGDFPFWAIMTHLALPVMALTVLYASNGGFVGIGNLIWPAITAYFYLLSCIIEFLFKRFTRSINLKRRIT